MEEEIRYLIDDFSSLTKKQREIIINDLGKGFIDFHNRLPNDLHFSEKNHKKYMISNLKHDKLTSHLMVMMLGDIPVAYCIYCNDKIDNRIRGRISEIFVTENAILKKRALKELNEGRTSEESKGIGTSILEKVIEELTRLGCEDVSLSASNEHAEKFYEKNGFDRLDDKSKKEKEKELGLTVSHIKTLKREKNFIENLQVELRKNRRINSTGKQRNSNHSSSNDYMR